MQKAITTTVFAIILALSLTATAATNGRESETVNALLREISRMESDVRSEQSRHQALWDDQNQDCVNEFVFRQQEILEASSALINSNSTLNKCTSGLFAARYDQNKAQGYVVSVNSILDNIKTQREIEHQRYEHILNDQLDPTIEAINGVFPLLDELSAQVSQNQTAQQSGASYLIQLRKQINVSFLQLVKSGKSIQFAAIFAELLNPELSQVGVTQETVDSLRSLFIDLLNDIVNEKQQLTQVENLAVEQYTLTVSAYNDILLTLDTTLSKLEVYMNELAACIETETSISETASEKQQRNQSALDHAVDMCQAFKKDFEDSSAQRDEEISLFSQLRTFVSDQEDLFGNYGVDNVDVVAEFRKSFVQEKSKSRANFLQLTLKEFKQNNGQSQIQKSASKCESCRKSFLQKKIGF